MSWTRGCTALVSADGRPSQQMRSPRLCRR
jgi:hypothetical protein